MNRQSYDAIADRWLATRTQLPVADARLIDLSIEPLRPGDRVLDLGCGTGRPIAHLLDRRGLRVTGVDQSARMLAFARASLPEQTWVLSAIEDYPFDESFDAIVAWDSLFHIPRAAHEAIFRRAHVALKAGGRFALTVGGSEHPAFTDTMFGHEFFYDSHAPEAALSLLRATGFAILRQEFLELPTGGRDKGRFAIVAAVE